MSIGDLIQSALAAERSLQASFGSGTRLDVLADLDTLAALLRTVQLPSLVAAEWGIPGVDGVDVGTEWSQRLYDARRLLRAATSTDGFRRTVAIALNDLAPLFNWARMESVCLA